MTPPPRRGTRDGETIPSAANGRRISQRRWRTVNGSMMALEARVGRANMLLPENEYFWGEKMRTEEGDDMNAELSKYNGGFMLSLGPDKRPAGWQG